jgi:ABC-type antimicrobial peptide transport system permease subunit
MVRFGHYSLSTEGLSIHATMTAGVLAAALVMAACLGMLAGAVPAWQVSRREITESFRAV